MTSPEENDAGSPAKTLRRHLAGDAQAFPELVQGFKAQVYTYLLRSSVDRHSCDDLFQEIFMKVHVNAKRFDQSQAFEPWLFTIVVNTVRSHFRKQRVRAIFLFSDRTEDRASTESSQEEQSVARQTATILQRSMQRLPSKEREALLLSAVQGLDYEKIATVMHVPLSTVKTLIRRARLKLAKELAREGEGTGADKEGQ